VTACRLCDGECDEADLRPLLADELDWVWRRIAQIADRRGDPALGAGAVTLTAPVAPEQRAAVLGLIPGRPLGAGQSRRVDLGALCVAVRRHGPNLTPGAVAAHAIGRRLATRARRRDDRAEFEHDLEAVGAAWAASSPSPVAAAWESAWSWLRRSGWVAKLQLAPDARALLTQAFSVVDALPAPGARRDRRVLASDITRDPHALDDGEPLAAMVLALLAGSRVASGRRPRDAWAAVGVDCDDLTGGLISVGIHPTGWRVPSGAVVTLPPRELTRCSWPEAEPAGGWVFVTENPSVASAAADIAGTGGTVRLLCTSGTPSGVEVAAIARLVDAGWGLAVRADFDAAGIAHVTTVLRAVPSAHVWRMTAADYTAARGGPNHVPMTDVPDTPWDPTLAAEMRTTGAAAFEEALLAELLDDLRTGAPRGATRRALAGRTPAIR